MLCADNGAVATLDLVPVPRNAPASPGQEDRARYVPRLREQGEQHDFVIDGERLSEQLRHLDVPEPENYGLQDFDLVSVADLVWPEAAVSALRQLAGVEQRSRDWPLEPGRLPLYVCPMCGDLGCGALTVEVVQEGESVTWRDFRVEDGLAHEGGIDLSSFGPITFDAAQYAEALMRPIPHLQALIEDEAAARTAWKQSRRPRTLLRRLARKG